MDDRVPRHDGGAAPARARPACVVSRRRDRGVTTYRRPAPSARPSRGTLIDRGAAGAQPWRRSAPRRAGGRRARRVGRHDAPVTFAPSRVEASPAGRARPARGSPPGHRPHPGGARGAERAVTAGAPRHLFNAMSGLHHRERGVAWFALADDRLTCDLICDGSTHPDPCECRRGRRATGSKITDRVDPYRRRCAAGRAASPTPCCATTEPRSGCLTAARREPSHPRRGAASLPPRVHRRLAPFGAPRTSVRPVCSASSASAVRSGRARADSRRAGPGRVVARDLDRRRVSATPLREP